MRSSFFHFFFRFIEIIRFALTFVNETMGVLFSTLDAGDAGARTNFLIDTLEEDFNYSKERYG